MAKFPASWKGWMRIFCAASSGVKPTVSHGIEQPLQLVEIHQIDLMPEGRPSRAERMSQAPFPL